MNGTLNWEIKCISRRKKKKSNTNNCVTWYLCVTITHIFCIQFVSFRSFSRFVLFIAHKIRGKKIIWPNHHETKVICSWNVDGFLGFRCHLLYDDCDDDNDVTNMPKHYKPFGAQLNHTKTHQHLMTAREMYRIARQALTECKPECCLKARICTHIVLTSIHNLFMWIHKFFSTTYENASFHQTLQTTCLYRNEIHFALLNNSMNANESRWLRIFKQTLLFLCYNKSGRTARQCKNITHWNALILLITWRIFGICNSAVVADAVVVALVPSTILMLNLIFPFCCAKPIFHTRTKYSLDEKSLVNFSLDFSI